MRIRRMNLREVGEGIGGSANQPVREFGGPP